MILLLFEVQSSVENIKPKLVKLVHKILLNTIH